MKNRVSNTLISMLTEGYSRIIKSNAVIKMRITVACNKLPGAYVGPEITELDSAGILL